MKTYLQHRKTKDICAEVLEKTGRDTYKVWWINCLGTYDHPNPFPMGSGSRGAIETIRILNKKDWRVEYDLGKFSRSYEVPRD